MSTTIDEPTLEEKVRIILTNSGVDYHNADYSGIQATLLERIVEAIEVTNAFDTLTSDRVLDFITKLQLQTPGAARMFFKAIANTGEVELLTSDRMFTYINSIDGSSAFAFLKAIAIAGKADVLTSERVIDFIQTLDSDSKREFLNAIASTKAVEALTSDRVMELAYILGEKASGYFSLFQIAVASDSVMEFAEHLRSLGEKVPDYFIPFQITGSSTVDDLTSERFISFVGGLSDKARVNFFNIVKFAHVEDSTKFLGNSAGFLLSDKVTNPRVRNLANFVEDRSFFNAILEKKDVDTITGDRVINFVREIGPELGSEFFLALKVSEETVSKTIELFDSDNVRDFVKDIGPGAAVEFFKAICQLRKPSVLINDKVMKFARAMGPEAAEIFFEIIRFVASRQEPLEWLLNDKVMSDSIARFARKMNGESVFNFFAVIHAKKSMEILTSPEVANDRVAKSANRLGPASLALFQALAYKTELLKEGLEYYLRLSEEKNGIATIRSFGLNFTPGFIAIAHSNLDKGSFSTERYAIACALNLLEGEELVRTLSEEGYAEKLLDTTLKGYKISVDGLTRDEKFALLKADSDYLVKNSGRINEFVRIRNGDVTTKMLQRLDAIKDAGFDLDAINQSVTIGAISLNGRSGEVTSVSAKDGASLLIYGINGSREKDREQEAQVALVQIFGEDKIDDARAAWAKIRKTNIPDIIAALQQIESDPNATFKAFRDAIGKEYSKTQFSEKEREILSDLIDAIEGMQTGINLQGKSIIAYTVKNTANVLSISSKDTSCCAFLPNGMNMWAAPRYGADPGVLLVNFGVSDARTTEPEVRGVAICALAVTKDGSRILYVDSVEGGHIFQEAAQGRELEIAALLNDYARSIGAEVAVFNAEPGNSMPKVFVQAVRDAEPEKIDMDDLKLLARKENYFEKGKKALILR